MVELAVEYRLQSIAFPNISTGVYGFPKALAAKIAIQSVNEFLKKQITPQEVIFVLFDNENENLYKALLDNQI